MVIQCPHCGAPPPTPIQAVGQFTYTCVYCQRQSLLGTPAPAAATPRAVLVVREPYPAEDEHRRARADARAAHRASWLVWVVVALAISLGGGAAGLSRCSRHSAILSGLVWDGSEPLHCGGNDEIAVSGVSASFTDGAAIVATGNCHVRCDECTLSAATIVEASGNAQVTLVGGSAKGTSVLADASGNARVTISGTRAVTGRVKESANAKVSAPAPATAEPAPTTPTPPKPVKPTATPKPTR